MDVQCAIPATKLNCCLFKPRTQYCQSMINAFRKPSYVSFLTNPTGAEFLVSLGRAEFHNKNVLTNGGAWWRSRCFLVEPSYFCDVTGGRTTNTAEK